MPTNPALMFTPTIDHHFFQKFSISANPLAMFAAAAQRTSRIRFRTALHTLPLENPIRPWPE